MSSTITLKLERTSWGCQTILAAARLLQEVENADQVLIPDSVTEAAVVLRVTLERTADE